MAVIGQHLQVTVYCYPLTSQILQCCPLRDFGRKQFHCQISCDLEVTNDSMHCQEISRYKTKKRCVTAGDEQLKNFLQNQLFIFSRWGHVTKVFKASTPDTHAFTFLLDPNQKKARFPPHFPKQWLVIEPKSEAHMCLCPNITLPIENQENSKIGSSCFGWQHFRIK